MMPNSHSNGVPRGYPQQQPVPVLPFDPQAMQRAVLPQMPPEPQPGAPLENFTLIIPSWVSDEEALLWVQWCMENEVTIFRRGQQYSAHTLASQLSAQQQPNYPGGG